MGSKRVTNELIHEKQMHVVSNPEVLEHATEAPQKVEQELTPEEEREIETAIGNIYQKPRPVMGVRLPDPGAIHRKNGHTNGKNKSALAMA